MRRQHLRTRVLLLTGAFTLALFAIAFGLSWRSRLAQQRWTRLISIETRAVASLEELIRAQNGFRTRFLAGAESPQRYRLVVQLLTDDSLTRIDLGTLRARIVEFRTIIHEIGHVIHRTNKPELFEQYRMGLDWEDTQKEESKQNTKLASKVSHYAWNAGAGNVTELVAEVFTGIMNGEKYDQEHHVPESGFERVMGSEYADRRETNQPLRN